MQGSLILARTDPGGQAWLNGVVLPVNEYGEFVFALWRDAPGAVRLEITRPGQVSELQRVEVLRVKKRSWEIQHIRGVAKEKVNPPKREYERIANEGSSMRSALSGSVTTGRFHEVLMDGFTQPVDGIVSGVFGSQRFFNGQPRRPHYGLDIAATSGTAVIAPSDGVVRFVHPDMFFNGKTLVVDHGQRVVSSFSHLSAILVAEGDEVTRGQLIARVGATGRVTGPHLHWQVSYSGIPVDPALLLEKDSAVCLVGNILC